MKKPINIHAKLTIYDIDKMSKKSYTRLVNWLSKTVEELKIREKGKYDKKFNKRLIK